MIENTRNIKKKSKNCCQKFFCNENYVFDEKNSRKSKISNNNFEKNVNNEKKTSSIDKQKNIIIVKQNYFILINDLLYYIDDLNLRKRLCIFKFMKKKFDLAHDENNYQKFQRIYDRVITNYYMKYFTRKLKKYIFIVSIVN